MADVGHDHGEHAHDRGHGHSHGIVDASIASTDRGLWALKWPFVGLMATVLIQVVVVVLSGSVGLLADTIHNFADAATTIPLGIAFVLARRASTCRFTYGLGRVEDLAGLAIILTITASAVVAAREAIQRLMHPQPVEMLWAVMAASIVGLSATRRWPSSGFVSAGRSAAALVADGYHARVDGWTRASPCCSARSVCGRDTPWPIRSSAC
jgi:cation diffusion facilitator family transporter